VFKLRGTVENRVHKRYMGLTRNS